MASVNRAIIIGNLGADPDLRYTQSQTPVATLSVATKDSRVDANGERQETTEWHRVVVWGRQAENCNKYLSKGRQVYIEGRLQTRSWDDKSGVKRYTTEIVAQTVQFLGGGARQEGGYQAPSPNQNQGYGNEQGGGGQQNYAAPEQDSFGATSSPAIDEIPF